MIIVYRIAMVPRARLVLREAGDRVVSARVVSRSDEVTCISSNGIMLRVGGFHFTSGPQYARCTCDGFE